MSESVGLGANVGAAWVALRFSARGASTQIRSQLRGETAALGSELGASSGENFKSSFGKRIDGLGASVKNALLPLAKYGGLGLAAIGVESVRMAGAFQSSMLKVRTQAGATQGEVNKMSKAILNMATGTQHGPDQLAESLYHLESLGLRGAKALQALRTSEQLADVSGADLESTTNAIGGAWRTGIKGAKSFGQSAATLNAIVGAGNMRMSDLLGALGTGILPAAKTFGLSLNQVGAALALFTDEGVPAQDAATRLRMSFSLLGAPSMIAQKELKSIGISGLELANAMRSPGGLIAAISLLKDHLDKSGMSASQQSALLSRAFGGGRSSSAILSMLNNLEVLRKKQEQVNTSTGKFGAAVVAQSKTASAQWHILASNLDVLAIKLGTNLLPLATKFAHFLSNTFIPDAEKLAKWLVSPNVKPWTEFVGRLAGAAVSARLIYTLLSKAAKLTGLSALAKSASKKTANATVSTASTNMRSAAGTMLDASLNMLKAAGLEADTTGAGGLGKVGKAGKAAGAAEGAAGAGALSRVKTAGGIAGLALLIDALGIKPLLQGMSSGKGGKNWWDNPFGQSSKGKNPGFLASWTPTQHAFETAWNDSYKAFMTSTGLPIARFFGKTIPNILTNSIPHWYDNVNTWWVKDVSDPFDHWLEVSLPDAFTKSIPNWYGDVQKWWVKDVSDPFDHWLEVSVPDAFTKAIPSWWSGAYTAFERSVGSPVAHWFSVSLPHAASATGNALVKAGKDVVGGFESGILSTAKGLGSWTNAHVIRPVTSQFSGARSWLVRNGEDAVDGFESGIVRIAGGIRSWTFAHVINPVTGAFGGARSWLIHGGESLIDGLESGILDRMRAIGSWIEGNVTSPVIGWIKKHFGIKSPSVVMHGIGFNLIAGLLRGIVTANPLGLIKDVFGSLPNALAHLVESGLVSVSKLPSRLLSMLGGLGGDVSGLLSKLFGGGGGSGPAVGMGQGLAALMGWTGGNWSALDWLWNRESGWRWNAKNPSSGAYGIPQALPASKMASAGADWMTNPATQIKWGLGYIKSVYGSPLGAAAHERQFGWYDAGGIARGVGFMPKNTPKPERVLSPQQTSAFERLVDVLDGRISGSSGTLRVKDGRVEFDPRKMEMWVRDLSVQEARAEIAFGK